MEASRPLLEELSLLGARALSLGEETAHVVARVVGIVLVLLVGWIAHRLLTILIGRVLRRLEASSTSAVRVQRARTLGPLLTSTSRYLVGFTVALVVLQRIGIDVRTLIVSAGVAGLAIGLGAQSLIRDVVSGFFLLFENLIAVGDVIEVGPHTGVVEAVGLRVTKIRKFSGELRIVPNGELAAFGLHTAGWARLVVEVSVDYEEDAGRALRVLGEVGRALADAYPAKMLEPPAAEGILRFGQGSLTESVLRLHARVVASEKFPLELEARRRVKEAFSANGIRVPRPAMDIRLAPSSGGGASEDGRKEVA
ncbi:MAG TPA: mechanosensitive ion channel family protein [Methylomirabilota bacterium]|jgi:small conductance mechanosensitive channel|nr:mechanosensitive ion channel family protein [Methylomirabilota bacterium]